MKYKNLDIVNAVNYLETLLDKKLPQKISYAIMKNMSLFKNEYKMYFDSLNKLIENYNDFILKDKEGKPILLQSGLPSVDKEHEEEFSREVVELLNIEVDIPIFKVSEETFNYEGEKYDVLSPKELMFMIELFGENESR